METKKTYSFFYRNGLSLVFLGLFIVSLGMQCFTGWKVHNEELLKANLPTLGFMQYFSTGHFISATFENFESEFLQMAMYVMLTVGLRQWGSAESKKLGEAEDVDREPQPGPNAPYPVRKGGWLLKFYQSSLSISFVLLFFASWAIQNIMLNKPLMACQWILLERTL